MLTEPGCEARPTTARPRYLVDRAPDPAYQPRAASAAAAARDAAVGRLLRCWVRERAIAEPEDGTLRLVLEDVGVQVEAPVEYWSPVGWHRFGPVRVIGGRDTGAGIDTTADAADPATLVALLAAEAGGGAPDSAADLVARVADSAANTARFLAARLTHPMDPAGTTPFLASEQALIAGHPLHPAPKSRDGLSEAQLAAYSPELRGSFSLHWFAAGPAIVSSDSTLPRSAGELMAPFTGKQLPVPAGMVPIPAHPWQAQDLLGHPGIRHLLDSGLLRYLGPGGDPWYPTSSLRTVYRADSPLMLKLSLGLRTTDSRCENQHKDPHKELRRGMEMSRLLQAGLGAELAAAHPGFAIVRDPAWLAVDLPGRDAPDRGLDVVLRENPFGPKELAHCVAGLVAERPGPGPSLLACLVRGLAVRSRRPAAEVARAWFGRYLETVAVPILWLYAEHGIALEARQQDTVVIVNAGGWPVGGRYLGNQGYYFAASRAAALARWLPGAGEEGDAIVEDAIADERLGYWLGVDNLMGLIGAFGSQGLADEQVLLADLRYALEGFAAPGARVPDLVHALLDRKTLRCEANLLTRISDLAEPVEPPATESVRVEIGNPLAAAGA